MKIDYHKVFFFLALSFYSVVAHASSMDCGAIYLSALQQQGVLGVASYFESSKAKDKLSEFERLSGGVRDVLAGGGERWQGAFLRHSVSTEDGSHYTYLGYDFHGLSKKLGDIKFHLARRKGDDCRLIAVHMEYQD